MTDNQWRVVLICVVMFAGLISNAQAYPRHSTETVEGLEVGQVIPVGENYWLESQDNFDPGERNGVRVYAGGEVTILGFEQRTLADGQVWVAVVRLHTDSRRRNWPRAQSGTVFILPLPLLQGWAIKGEIAKKYLEEDKR